MSSEISIAKGAGVSLRSKWLAWRDVRRELTRHTGNISVLYTGNSLHFWKYEDKTILMEKIILFRSVGWAGKINRFYPLTTKENGFRHFSPAFPHCWIRACPHFSFGLFLAYLPSIEPIFVTIYPIFLQKLARLTVKALKKPPQNRNEDTP